MFPPFPQERAFEDCKCMLSELADNSLRIEKASETESERSCPGVMLGSLACKDKDGRELFLRCLLGTSRILRPRVAEDGRHIYIDGEGVTAQRIADALSKNDAEIHALTAAINALKQDRETEASEEEKALAARRKLLTTESLVNVHKLYSFHCADGSVRTLQDICRERLGNALPPTGTGDCCAPKLLDYAFAHGFEIQSLCEVFYYITPPAGSVPEPTPCPPCDERCGIILPALLGIEILYRDTDILVVNKQSGLLSVPGRGPDKQDCIVNRVRRLFPDCIAQPAVHRLDMETSGLLVLAFTREAHRELCRQFEAGEVQKQYVALADGILAKKGIAEQGTMELYFRLDVENRPHQIWDSVHGKKAITEWQILDVERYHAPDGTVRHASRVLFTPHTGRTHQLRLASADAHGFGIPIIGDTLYGSCAEGERLMLHAQSLSFHHPATGEKMDFFCPSRF